MNIYLAWVITTLGWICWPVVTALYHLAISIIFLLKLLYRPLAFLLQPVVYLGRFVLVCLALPFQLIAKLEPLYDFLGVAALVGVIVGLAIAYIYNKFHVVLQLDFEPEPHQKPGRTAKEYRKAKAKQKSTLIDTPPLSPEYVSLSEGLGTGPRYRNRGLLAQTIMEEGDSDY